MDSERNEKDLNRNCFSKNDFCDYGHLKTAAPAPATDAGERSPPAPDPAPAGELAGELMATSGARGATSGASGASSGASGANYETDNENNNKENY